VSWREKLKKRSLIYGGGSVAAALLVLGILVFVGLLSQRFSWRLDITPEKSQSLSPITEALLRQVDKPLTMTVFLPEGREMRQKARDLLDNYVYQNRLVSYRIVDPTLEPLEAQQAGFRYPGNTLVEYQDRRQMANAPEEEAITNALRRVLKPEVKKLYFLTGHGERSLEDTEAKGFQEASQALAREGYQVQDLNLLALPEGTKETAVPGDAAAVVVAAPVKPLFSIEVAALKRYLDGGGRLLVMLQPFEDGGLKNFLAAYGVGLEDGIILDKPRALDLVQGGRVMGTTLTSPYMILVQDYGEHRITRDFTGLNTIYPLARPLGLKPGAAPGVTLLALATSTANCWVKPGKEWQKDKKIGFDPKVDRRGPFVLAALAEIKKEEPRGPGAGPKGKAEKPEEANKAYLVVFGNADFADNNYLSLAGNRDLFLNTLNFLAGETKQIIIRRDERKGQPLTLSLVQLVALLLISLIILPFTMLGLGIRAYRRRRVRR
jgi:ABC-type uncharacterized transport system involved in gliding motility auxiliary subunit